MKNITDTRTLRSRVIARLVNDPGCLEMRFFSRQTEGGTKFCLAGLILSESNIRMEYDVQDGRARSLPLSVVPPSSGWLEYELKRAQRSHDPLGTPRPERCPLAIAAKAREVWSEAYGVDEARFLPFYAHDWECRVDDVTPDMVVQRLQGLAVLSTAKAG
jgi:hypothetical protein